MNDGDRCCCHSDMRCKGCTVHGADGQRHGNEYHSWPNVWTDDDSRMRTIEYRAALNLTLDSRWTKWEAEVADLQPLVGLFVDERNNA